MRSKMRTHRAKTIRRLVRGGGGGAYCVARTSATLCYRLLLMTPDIDSMHIRVYENACRQFQFSSKNIFLALFP